MDPKEKVIEEGLAIQDLERTEGWAIIKAKITEESQATLADLRRIELEGRSLGDIGSDYIARIQRINDLERVLEIVTEIKEAHEEATRNHHG
jgi:hypothetical protein